MNKLINQLVNKPNILSLGFAIAYALFAYGVGSAALFWFLCLLPLHH